MMRWLNRLARRWWEPSGGYATAPEQVASAWHQVGPAFTSVAGPVVETALPVTVPNRPAPRCGMCRRKLDVGEHVMIDEIVDLHVASGEIERGTVLICRSCEESGDDQSPFDPDDPPRAGP